jgi:hypothetical protein
MPGLRRQGVYGESNPTKKTLSVQPAVFTVAAIMGFFERKFTVPFPSNTPQDVWRQFGQRLNQPSTYYGPDAVDGFFANLKGAGATLWVSSPNWSGDVAATLGIPDTMGTVQYPLTIQPGLTYLGVPYPQYGAAGNRVGVRIETGVRYTVAATATSSAGASQVLSLSSVAGIYVGDIVTGAWTGGTPGTQWGTVTAVNPILNQITVTVVTTATTMAIGDPLSVSAFKIHTWYKTPAGAETEVDVALSQQWLSLNPNATPYYAPAVFANSNYLLVSVNTTTSTADKKTPSGTSFTNATTLYPTAVAPSALGVDGTQPANAAAFTPLMQNLNNIPFVMACLPETTDIPTQKAFESYLKNRTTNDSPKALVHGPEAMSKSSMLAWGVQYQRADDVMQVNIGHWLLATDPYATSPTAPPRHVPATGHAMGAWIQSIYFKGIHYIPATKDINLLGCIGVSGDQILNDVDRTDVCNAGVNVVQQLPGYGIVIRNFFTPSTTLEFQWANGVLMREFIKASVTSSMQGRENTPNSYAFLKESKAGILNFLINLWNAGSTGNVPTGETFGQTFASDGVTPTKFSDHFEVKADAINNPQSGLNAGQQNYDVYFTYPVPAGSIRIGVGILLRN